MVYGDPRKVLKGGGDEEVVFTGADDGGVRVTSGEDGVGISVSLGHGECWRRPSSMDLVYGTARMTFSKLSCCIFA